MNRRGSSKNGNKKDFFNPSEYNNSNKNTINTKELDKIPGEDKV